MTRERIAELRVLCDALPQELAADWDGTNHYEVNMLAPSYKWAWLDVPSIFEVPGYWSDTVHGRRLGQLLDLACAARTALPEALDEIERLRARLAEQGDAA